MPSARRCERSSDAHHKLGRCFALEVRRMEADPKPVPSLLQGIPNSGVLWITSRKAGRGHGAATRPPQRRWRGQKDIHRPSPSMHHRQGEKGDLDGPHRDNQTGVPESAWSGGSCFWDTDVRKNPMRCRSKRPIAARRCDPSASRPGSPPPGRQVEGGLRGAIRSGLLRPGQRSSPHPHPGRGPRGLAAPDVEAFEQLAGEGWLMARVEAGTFARDTPPFLPSAPMLSRRTHSGPRGSAGRRRFDFFPGHPDLARFPRRDWARATRDAIRELPDAVFGYGDPRGLRELRVAVAAMLARTRGVICEPHQVIIGQGAVQALNLLVRATGSQLATGPERPGGCVAGLHALVRLERPAHAQALASAAERRDVNVYPLSFWQADPPPETSAVVLGYGQLHPTSITEGVWRLADAGVKSRLSGGRDRWIVA